MRALLDHDCSACAEPTHQLGKLHVLVQETLNMLDALRQWLYGFLVFNGSPETVEVVGKDTCSIPPRLSLHLLPLWIDKNMAFDLVDLRVATAHTPAEVIQNGFSHAAGKGVLRRTCPLCASYISDAEELSRHIITCPETVPLGRGTDISHKQRHEQ